MIIKEVTENMILGMIVLGGGGNEDHNSSYDRSKNRPMG